MREVIENFRIRYGEVEQYLAMLQAIEDPGAVIRSPNGTETAFDPAWVNITRSAGYLIIYNCVEATVRTAFACLYDQVHGSLCTYEQLRQEFRQIWVEQQHKAIDSYSASTKTYAERALRMLDDAVGKAEVVFDPRKLPVSGNLDADRLRDIMQRHGIGFVTTKNAAGGHRLTSVRQKRNNLSHGDLSFVECGRGVTGSELLQTARQTKYFLLDFLRSIQSCINGSQYLSA